MIQTKTAPNNSSVFGSFFKTFVKVKKPDEKFIEMKETIDKFEDNLNIVEKLYSRIGKRQMELEQNYHHFAGSIRGLSALETNVDQPLRQFAEATESYVEALKEMVRLFVCGWVGVGMCALMQRTFYLIEKPRRSTISK